MYRIFSIRILLDSDNNSSLFYLKKKIPRVGSRGISFVCSGQQGQAVD